MALVDMDRGKMAIAEEETIEAGKGISGLGCWGAGMAPGLYLVTRSVLVANCPEMLKAADSQENLILVG